MIDFLAGFFWVVNIVRYIAEFFTGGPTPARYPDPSPAFLLGVASAVALIAAAVYLAFFYSRAPNEVTA